MNPLRHQIPVRSPLSLPALLVGMRAALSRNGAHEHAAARVEALLRARYAPRSVLLTETGTAALTAALMGLQRSSALQVVAIPAYACWDIATAVEGAGARALLYDIDPQTLTPDVAQIDVALRQGATAVVVAHLYGCPVDLDEINRLATAAGAVVIEDAAQGAGAMMHDRPVGMRGSLGVFSFGRGKGLTGGSGGALLAFDDRGSAALERARERLGTPRRGWGELGTLAAQLVFERPTLYAFPASLPFLHLGETIYRDPRTLRASPTVACAVVAATWKLADGEAEARRANADRLRPALRYHPGFLPIEPLPHARPGYLRLPAIASPRARLAVTAGAARRLGIMPGYPQALCDVDRVRRFSLNGDEGFPGSRLLAARLCTFPTHSRLAAGDLRRLTRWIREAGSS